MAIAIILIVPLLLAAFWVWMFNDMLQNDHLPGSEPPALRWPPVAKNHWTVFFIVFNIFTAGYYYFTEYRTRIRG